MPLKNPILANHRFLAEFAEGQEDFPTTKLRTCFQSLCAKMDKHPMCSEDAFYTHAQAAASEINRICEQGFTIDTDLRELLAEEFALVAWAYGMPEIDIERAISTRDW